jgi:Kef-type K+ transport system membrane component KefB
VESSRLNPEQVSGSTARRHGLWLLAGSAFVIWIAGCVGVGRVTGAIQDETMIVIGLLISLAGNVLYVVWAFKAKQALQEYCLDEYRIDLKMNVFYVVLMNVYYINYCINDLPEVQRKEQILRERTVIAQ